MIDATRSLRADDEQLRFSLLDDELGSEELLLADDGEAFAGEGEETEDLRLALMLALPSANAGGHASGGKAGGAIATLSTTSACCCGCRSSDRPFATAVCLTRVSTAVVGAGIMALPKARAVASWRDLPACA